MFDLFFVSFYHSVSFARPAESGQIPTCAYPNVIIFFIFSISMTLFRCLPKSELCRPLIRSQWAEAVNRIRSNHSLPRDRVSTSYAISRILASWATNRNSPFYNNNNSSSLRSYNRHLPALGVLLPLRCKCSLDRV